ncbi:MAG: mevalonate kinase [Flavobacteriales bacterium]|nr:mevalonate kinase [Flavobacteriales bacterium]
MSTNPLFYAKILLFGEYGIIEDSMGLSIPFNFYKGTLIKANLDKEENKRSNLSLFKFYDYLKGLSNSDPDFNFLDLDSLKSDIEEGLTFDSSIPQGFGIGSSGALVAAIYDQYAIAKIEPDKNIHKADILTLKKYFGTMESYFHGKSSGLDPLICYLKLPMLIKSGNDIDTIGIPTENKEGKGAIFLIDSGTPGETAPMVNIFMEKMKQEGFRKVISEQFKKYNDECINAFLRSDYKPLLKSLKKLSNVVLKHFKPMIPLNFHEIWKEGIDTNSYYLKLCGSGGGGYILGFAPDYEKALPVLSKYKPEVIYTF